MLRQERLLWRLQDLKLVEDDLLQSDEVKAVVGKLKEFQEKVKTGEKELQTLLQMIEKTEEEIQTLEEESGCLVEQLKINKKKLYEAKGSSLKELLSLQQAVLKLESQGQETEEKYWDFLKKIEEYKQQKNQYQETIKIWQKEFAEGLTQYQKMKAELDLKLAEIKNKQEEVVEQLLPEVKKLYLEAEKRYPLSFVAKLHQGSCLGCHISVSSVSERRVKEGKVLQHCDNCGRILISFF
ncbi:MAG: zinc ribbon domain-containing protein [Peptococcia bacterium]|jgi:predicted  nucleic acid-binding Zn-ribbon protein